MSDIEREKFEQAVTDRWSDSYSFTRFGDEDYYDEVLEGMWQGWQASHQALEGEAIGFLQSSGVSQLSGGHPAKLYPIGATPSPFESSTLVYTHPARDGQDSVAVVNKASTGEYEFYPSSNLVDIPNGMHKLYTHPASRQALEGEPVGYTNQYQLDKFPLGESGYVFRDKRDDSTIPLYTHPASAATLQFGNGNLVVTGGSLDDVPAVFISPAIDLGNAPGTALSGKDAERRTDMLYGDETVLLFKTAEHASVVVGALIRGNDASADKWIKCSEQRPNVLDVWIKMTDGSVVACWAQLDGDFYWKGGGSESFILEHTVTHWKPRQEEQGHE